MVEKKSIIRIPHHLPKFPFQDYIMLDLENSKDGDVYNEVASEMTIDVRDKKAIKKAKYNDQVDTLNADFRAYKQSPELISDQAGCDEQLHYLEK